MGVFFYELKENYERTTALIYFLYYLCKGIAGEKNPIEDTSRLGLTEFLQKWQKEPNSSRFLATQEK